MVCLTRRRRRQGRGQETDTPPLEGINTGVASSTSSELNRRQIESIKMAENATNEAMNSTQPGTDEQFRAGVVEVKEEGRETPTVEGTLDQGPPQDHRENPQLGNLQLTLSNLQPNLEGRILCWSGRAANGKITLIICPCTGNHGHSCLLHNGMNCDHCRMEKNRLIAGAIHQVDTQESEERARERRRKSLRKRRRDLGKLSPCNPTNPNQKGKNKVGSIKHNMY
ncbi:hypothetical protein AMECASPLE_023237 [Ameca splendens]|uniref:Uncharacterized protein n=1 Tax=Ameca splendens TaxID=208324 RepID=A0ABV0ZDB1_9TELE